MTDMFAFNAKGYIEEFVLATVTGQYMWIC